MFFFKTKNSKAKQQRGNDEKSYVNYIYKF